MQLMHCFWQPRASPQNRRLKSVTPSQYQSERNRPDRLRHCIYITVTFEAKKWQPFPASSTRAFIKYVSSASSALSIAVIYKLWLINIRRYINLIFFVLLEYII